MNNSTKSKKTSITYAVATETIDQFKQLVVDLNDKLKKQNLVYLWQHRDDFFKPTSYWFKQCKTIREYLKQRYIISTKIPAADLAYLIEDCNAEDLANHLCTKAEYDEFKKNGYNSLRKQWLADQATKQNNVDAIKRKIENLQAQLAQLED